MARGRFGRRRGTSSNMTALIASLLREQRAAEDRQMFDAWQNGGKVQGKAVTDDRLLAYIKSRRDGFSTDDPLYDEWNNRLTQYGFSIGEQKIGLKYKQGKVGAGAVAAFYRDQLKSIPKNSAFYREVAGRAAQFSKAVSGAARGRARASASAGLRSKLNQQLYTQQNYLALEAALTEYAKREGIISGNQSLSDADATELTDMFDRGISMSDGTQITLDAFRNAAQDHYKAITSEIKTREALGQQGIEARNKRSRFLSDTVVRLNAVDERAQYEMARDHWLDAVEAAKGDPYAVQAANEAYTRSLKGIYRNAANQTGTEEKAIDADFLGGLSNEFDAITSGKASGPTVAQMYGEDGDAESTAASIAELNDNLKALDAGTAYYGQDSPGGEMGVYNWPTGGRGGLGLDDSLQPSVTRVNGEKRVVWLRGEPVTASTILDANGKALSQEEVGALDATTLRRGLASGEFEYKEGQNVGYVFTNTANGTVKYGVIDPQTGAMLYSDENPWARDGQDPLIAGLGGGLTAFVGADARGRPMGLPTYYANGQPKPISIDTFDPALADSSVAPKDLLALIGDGTIRGLGDADLAKYQARLQRAEQERLTTNANRDLGLQDSLGIGGSTNPNHEPVVYRDQVASGMTNIADVTRKMFGSPGKAADDLFVPPPPPPAPTPTAADIYKPKTGSIDPKDTSIPKPKPGEVITVDRGEEGRGAGGNWGGGGRGAGGNWGTPLNIPKPKLEQLRDI